jgi:hypothetical protein
MPGGRWVTASVMLRESGDIGILSLQFTELMAEGQAVLLGLRPCLWGVTPWGQDLTPDCTPLIIEL